jgi:hypothetical protein
MNWFELRPLLREKFGRDFYFYNDAYRTGNRRIKISSYSLRSEMLKFIKSISPNLDAKLYQNHYLTIHYKK